MEHPGTGRSMHNLAFTWEGQGRLDDALDLMHQCVQLLQKVLGPDHPDSKVSLSTLQKWSGKKQAATADGSRSWDSV